MAESIEKKNNQQSLPQLKQLPIVEIVQNLHTYNVNVAKICRQHSLNLFSNYYQNKTQYIQIKQPKYDAKAHAAAEFGQNKKKTIEMKQKDMAKKNHQNITKLDHILNQKRINLEKKQAKMMEQSEARRLQFLKSLRSSFYVSQDKRYHIKQKESKELERSLQLQKQNMLKASAAHQRRGSVLNQLKKTLKKKNYQSGIILQQCREKQQLRNSQLCNKIVEKLEITHRSLQERSNQIQKKLSLKKKEEQKHKQKQLKNRSKVLEEKENKLEKQDSKVKAKLSKANFARQTSLKLMKSSKQFKRQLKEKELMQASMQITKQKDNKLNDLKQRLYNSQQFFNQSKEFKEKLRCNHLYDYCKISHQLNK